MCNFNVDFSKIFWGLCPQTHILGRSYGAPPRPHPPRLSGASRLHASLGTFGPSIVVSPLYKNPGYAPDDVAWVSAVPKYNWRFLLYRGGMAYVQKVPFMSLKMQPLDRRRVPDMEFRVC